MTEQELEAEQQRLHKVGQATVQRLIEEHGMSHKFPTGPTCYCGDPKCILNRRPKGEQ